MPRAKVYSIDSGMRISKKDKKLDIQPDPTAESREPNRSIKNELPHLMSLYKLEKFELRKKLEKLGIEDAELNKMTFNEMQSCYSNMVED